MIHHNSLGLRIPNYSLAAIGPQVCQGCFASFGGENAPVEHRHEAAAGGQHILILFDPWVAGGNALRHLAM